MLLMPEAHSIDLCNLSHALILLGEVSRAQLAVMILILIHRQNSYDQ